MNVKQKIAGVLIVSMVCVCFAGCKGNNEEKEHIDLGNQYMEEFNYEQALAEYMMALEINAEDEKAVSGIEEASLKYAESLLEGDLSSEECSALVSMLEKSYQAVPKETIGNKIKEIKEQINIGDESESNAEITEEVSFDGYEFIVYDLFDPTKDIIAFNIPNGFEPMFEQNGQQKGRIYVDPTGVYFKNEDYHTLTIGGDEGYYRYFEYDGVDEEKKEFYDSQRKILDTLEIGEIETQFGSAKIYKIELGYPDDSLQDSDYREMMEESGYLDYYYEENGIFYLTTEGQVAVFCIDGYHVEVAYNSGEQDFEELLHQMFDL